MKVESVLAPFMGYLGAKQSGDPQLAQSRLSEMTKALDSLRQVQQMKMDREMSKYDAYSKMAMGVRDIGYGKRAEAEARQIDATEARLRKATEQAVADGMMTPEYANMMLKNYEAETARDTYESAKQAGTIPAQQYQKTQEALLGGKTAEQALIQEKPRYTAEADIAKAQATTETAIPSAREQLLTDTAKRKQEEQNAIDQAGLNKSLTFSRYNTASGVSPDSYKQIYTEYRDAQNDYNSLNAEERGIQSILSRIQRGASSNDLMGLALNLGVSLPDTTGQDENTAKQTISSWATNALNDIQNRKKAINYVISSRGETMGIPSALLPKPDPVPNPNAIKNTISQKVWDALPIERQQALKRLYGETLQIVPETQTFSERNRAKPATQKQTTSTGNEIKSKPKTTTPTNKKTSSTKWSADDEEMMKRMP